MMSGKFMLVFAVLGAVVLATVTLAQDAAAVEESVKQASGEKGQPKCQIKCDKKEKAKVFQDCLTSELKKTLNNPEDETEVSALKLTCEEQRTVFKCMGAKHGLGDGFNKEAVKALIEEHVEILDTANAETIRNELLERSENCTTNNADKPEELKSCLFDVYKQVCNPPKGEKDDHHKQPEGWEKDCHGKKESKQNDN